MTYSNTLQPLLRTPEPIFGESFRGYVLRLSEENGCVTPATMYGYAGLHHLKIRLADPPVEIIAALTGKQIDRFNEIRYSFPERVDGSLSGHRILKPYLQIRHPKLCVECIKELGYIPAIWDLMNINVCHIHKVRLITHCGSCEKRINWHRPGLLTCQCGEEIRNKGEVEYSKEKIDLIYLIASVINRSPLKDEDSKTGMPFSIFSKMSLQTLLGLSISLGGRRAMFLAGRKKRIANGLDNSDLLLEAAAIVLSEWPKNFLSLFELKQHSNKNKSNTFWESNKDIYSIIFKMDYPEEEIKFFRELISNYAVTKSNEVFVDYRISKYAKDNSQNLDAKRGLLFTELVKMLDVHPVTLKRKIRDGELEFETYSISGKKYYVYNHEKHKSKIDSFKGELGQRESAAYVGLPLSILKFIRSECLYLSKYKTEKSTCWAIEDLDELITLFKNKCHQENSGDELISLNDLFKLPSLETKQKIIRYILSDELGCVGGQKSVRDIQFSKKIAFNIFKELKGYSNT